MVGHKGAAGLAVTALLALGGAACGSSSTPTASTGGSGTTTTTAAASSGSSSGSGTFVTKVNGICKSVNSQIAAISAPGDPTKATASDLPAWAHYFQQTIPLAQSGTNQLKAQTPPAGLQANFNTLVQSDEAQTSDAQAAQQAASGGDLSGFQQAVQKVASDGTAGDNAAKAAGLTDCASNG